MLMALVMSLQGVIAGVADGPALGDADQAPETEEFLRESPDPDWDQSEWQLGVEASCMEFRNCASLYIRMMGSLRFAFTSSLSVLASLKKGFIGLILP